MEPSGRTIKIYVRGKSPRALRSIEIVNWSGKAFMGNKSHIKQLKEISELAEAHVRYLENKLYTLAKKSMAELNGNELPMENPSMSANSKNSVGKCV